MSAGFIPDLELFIVVMPRSIDATLEIFLFDSSGAPHGSAMPVDGLQVFEAGRPHCLGSRCLVPFSEQVVGGPTFGVVELDFDNAPISHEIISHEILTELDVRGRLSLLDTSSSLWATIGPARLHTGEYPGLTVQDPAADFDPTWPLSLSAWSVDESIQRRLLSLRSVSCGNGIVQAQEECDDGNDISGDGCSSTCSLEVEESDEGSDESADEVGDTSGEGGLDQEEGCSCDTRHEPKGATALSLGLLVALSRRRRLCLSSRN
ncbi:DUF4215 domain-containing protein [Pseudenhygromyxa sp. WMMC2535]|uniref:myxococcus cysteine-rich repeat containing protein n=1 Tax=Pseudenhygromyxa sp. WMMC2535 TaxID=2712867 RepID=UPI0015571D12|nr:myxococcus cysteine-rich repeat containing protein [Pseudenhygromyxa sp. WMMC2535]NVB40186.1 DUF4215 domain-containing protein [Pseudenhygromyxa sp. WMMC2535]